MRFRTFIFVILGLTLLFSSSCVKKNDVIPNYLYVVHPNLYPLFFHTGSFWVYGNQDSTAIDSIVLKKTEIDTIAITPINPDQGYTEEVQICDMTYQSSLSGEYHEQLVGYVISRGGINGGFIYLSSHQLNDSVANAKITGIFSSMTVAGTTYTYVTEMGVDTDQYISTPMNLYYVDEIGVIRKELKSDGNITETWDLLRYGVSLSNDLLP